MTRRGFVWVSSVLLLVAAGSILALPSDVPAIRSGARFENVPEMLDGWRSAGSLPADVLPGDTKVTDRLARTFRKDDLTVWLSADYYALQTEGTRLPVQELLMPRSGWSSLATHAIEVDLGPRRMPANLVVMKTTARRLAIVYWYQLGDTSVASDHVYRAVAMYRRLVERRADMALVRVAMPIGEQADPEAAVARLSGFIRALQPELVRSLPRHRSQEE